MKHKQKNWKKKRCSLNDKNNYTSYQLQKLLLIENGFDQDEQPLEANDTGAE